MRQPQDGTFAEFLAECKEHGRTIFVRAKLGGKWGSYSFGTLSPQEQRETADQWYTNNHQPIRVKE